MPPAAPDTAPPPLAALRAHYQARKADLLAHMQQSRSMSARGVHKLLAGLSALADESLRALWQAAGFCPRCALLAVGGYGRGELFPHSDVDVLVLLPEGADPAADPALRHRLEAFISNCWDLGLEIGSSVRTPAQSLALAAQDLSVQTALLEARPVAGNASAFHAFQRDFMAQLDALDFFNAKRQEMRQRHAKYEDTPYALEPNCKESPGGLRDIQLILWAARAAGLGHRWEDLARAGLATAHELRQLRHNEAQLTLIRTRLHLIARRREDRLVFDLQTAVAESFGLSHRYAPNGRMALRAGEVLMRRYYWAAKAVTQLSQILLQNIEELLRTRRGHAAAAPRRINARFCDKAGLIEVASDQLYQRQPRAILETFLLYAQTPGLKGLSTRTLRALYNARSVMDHRFRHDPVNRRTFLAILQQPSGVTHALRLMNQTSVLGRTLWAFRRIVGQMQHDLFHVYTVDQHILMVVRNMRRFFMAEHAHEYPFCSQLAAGWDKPWLLYAAALFHDIAKGRGGDHSSLGAAEVRRFSQRHGISQADARLLEFLVREHLSMSQIAQKEDLSDPEVIAAFAARVGDERRLTALYLLTVADVRGTSPKVWNAWKAKLLEDLYKLTVHALGGRAPDPDALIESNKRQALAQLSAADMPAGAHQPLWNALDLSYFMRHDAGDIAWHTAMLWPHAREAESRPAGNAAAPPPAIVRARLSPLGEGLQVLVYAPDQPDLFARLCGYFDRAGFSILHARIHTTRSGHALDTFQLTHPGEAERYHERIHRVEAELPQAIANTQPLPAPRLGRASRRVRSFPIPPRIDLRPDDKAQHWLLTITTSDRPGLLYGIARVLAAHHINLSLAKITTLGERAEDMFLLQGESLQHPRTQRLIEQELLRVLGEQD